MVFLFFCYAMPCFMSTMNTRAILDGGWACVVISVSLEDNRKGRIVPKLHVL